MSSSSSSSSSSSRPIASAPPRYAAAAAASMYAGPHSPEIEIVHRSLHIAHVDVEGEQVDLLPSVWQFSSPSLAPAERAVFTYRRQCSPRQHLEEIRQSLACSRIRRGGPVVAVHDAVVVVVAAVDRVGMLN